MGLLTLFSRKTFAHGVHPEEHKELTQDRPIRRLAFPGRLILPLSQHFGRPSRPLVRVGQEVVRGEPIAEADGFISVPMHAPATGVVEYIGLMPSARGPKHEAVVLRPYSGAAQRVLYGAERDVGQLDRQQLIQAVQDTGMVGLGGAGFPTHVKLSVPARYRIDTLVVNGCECEPYLTTDHRVMLEQAEQLLAGIRYAMRAVGAERAIIGVEDNKMDAVQTLRGHLSSHDKVTVEPVVSKYPQGSEKLLIKVLLGREVPSGGYPYEIGVVVQNVATLAQLGYLLPRQQGIIERVITVTGPGVARPGNYMVPIGMPISEILDQVGFEGDAGQLILGGPMMGGTAASLEVPVTKATSGLLVLNEAVVQKSLGKTYPCIGCGQCLSACPVGLNPSHLGLLAGKREYAAMAEDFHLNDCFECGCCAYVCPSNIPLVQYFRIAKSINRERAA